MIATKSTIFFFGGGGFLTTVFGADVNSRGLHCHRPSPWFLEL